MVFLMINFIYKKGNVAWGLRILGMSCSLTQCHSYGPMCGCSTCVWAFERTHWHCPAPVTFSTFQNKRIPDVVIRFITSRMRRLLRMMWQDESDYILYWGFIDNIFMQMSVFRLYNLSYFHSSINKVFEQKYLV